MRSWLRSRFAIGLNAAVIDLHCFCQSPGRSQLDCINRLGNHLFNRNVLPSRNAREHKLRQVRNRVVWFDSQSDPAELLSPEPFDHRFQTLLTACAALAPYTDHTERKRDIITDYNQARPFTERV